MYDPRERRYPVDHDYLRDRITEFYFGHVVEKMSAMVIDRPITEVTSVVP